jgi:DNA-binding XRE family transcriptional regulator
MKPQQKELFYKKLGENIAKARSETKVTQAELAEKTGLSRTTITNIERGR